MRRGPHRIRRIRRLGTLTALTALSFAALTTADEIPYAPNRTSAGPAAVPGRIGVGTCRLTPGPGVQMSEGTPTPPGYSRSTGEIRALNLMIDFSDAVGEGKALDRLAEFFPQTTDWFRTSSYGRLHYLPQTPVRDWLRMPLPFEEYAIERGAPYDPAYRKLVDDVIAVADPQVDFSAYDLVNVLVTPNAGPSALDTVLSVTFSGNAEAPVADGVPLANTSFVYSRQDDGSGTHAETGFRVLPHENGHVFGLPDLYTADGGGAVGHWDIMSEDWGVNNDLLAWHKWKLGWLDAQQIGCASAPGSTTYTLTPLARPDGPKMTYIPLSGNSGYAVEVRTRGGNDEAVCRPGVLIYRVHGDVDTGEGPVTVMDSQEDSGGCTRRPNVHAELSDAPYQPGQTFTDKENGVRIAVLSGRSGTYRIHVTRT
ncbi:M6 family metalloprotease domain-containing protein [Streptomyces clavuligerus]|uniref:Secreted protein n=1 Tax=Streptomyces clavuligerus TaxID=1901 RepID=E2Q7K8_STRCL|nr:M6 family metalloprotease domain-containing protein [Streptomyces clavuligerus]ANW19742.1 M6 family metalloprotease domain-containing protein [Streptomyces clavuligerus]AXU14356.1 M6 family metalloprotease domain-containing protein [Streptomyces clavuligerus]EFG07414.1 Secreted protein [Streptomyces clavuligerus]MBY6304359.1 M6 family metalloprotease domain-containing protein [Streptomyces clavuligerus]QCS07130.1 M6 family metalloprotease domain-containing protein [Streptomyces clavuligerus